MQFVFGDYVLDPERRELTRGSEAIAVGPQVFDLLLYRRNREQSSQDERMPPTLRRSERDVRSASSNGLVFRITSGGVELRGEIGVEVGPTGGGRDVALADHEIAEALAVRALLGIAPISGVSAPTISSWFRSLP